MDHGPCSGPGPDMCINLKHLVYKQMNQRHALFFQSAFATALLTYIWNMIRMEITEEEMAVYTGTLLMCPHRAGLTAAERISALQHAMNDALQNNVRPPSILNHYPSW